MTILTPEQVRAVVEARNDGEPALAERIAKQLGISRRTMFNYLRDGVSLDVPNQTRAMLDAAGVEIVAKQKGKR